MEALLHYAWKHRLYENVNLQTIEGIPFEIIDPGFLNTHAGPDFFNAKIKLDGQLWVGNVEIHTCSSDWYKHHHETDKAYNSVILHVCEFIDELEIRNEEGRTVPQCIIRLQPEFKKKYLFLLKNENPVPCAGRIHEVSSIYLNDWKSALLYERLEQKTQLVFRLLEEYKEDWNEVFYIILSRNFGFGVNNDAFERLAKSLPLKTILKHRDSVIQTEALFFGQTGLLDDEIPEETYYLRLQNEYAFLKQKYKLKAIESHIFKSLRMRPANFPHIKLVQLAHIIRNNKGLFAHILKIKNVNELRPLFIQDIGEYWQNHYHFKKTSPKQIKQLGTSSLQILWINTVIPVLFAYGKRKDNVKFCDKALEFLESMKPEKNYIITAFSNIGIEIENAGDTQALIQLKRQYCELKKCIYCRIGHNLLAKE